MWGEKSFWIRLFLELFVCRASAFVETTFLGARNVPDIDMSAHHLS